MKLFITILTIFLLNSCRIEEGTYNLSALIPCREYTHYVFKKGKCRIVIRAEEGVYGFSDSLEIKKKL